MMSDAVGMAQPFVSGEAVPDVAWSLLGAARGADAGSLHGAPSKADGSRDDQQHLAAFLLQRLIDQRQRQVADQRQGDPDFLEQTILGEAPATVRRRVGLDRDVRPSMNGAKVACLRSRASPSRGGRLLATTR